MRFCIIRFAKVSMLLLAASAAFGAERAPKLKTKPYTFEAADGRKVEAELGELRVPENRQAKDSRTLTLRFVRFPSTAAEPGPPIIYLAGGPGGSGIDAARGPRFPLFMAMREFGDVIAFDQRGTGMSGWEEIDCDEPYMLPFGQAVDRETAGPILASAAAKCAERLTKKGVDVAGWDTLDSAADLDDLRRALGVEKLRLWGISYGTHLALATMKYHPGAVDRVVLAGVEGLDQTLKLPSDQQRLLEEIARLAKADPEVREALPDFLGSIRRLLDRLAKEPATVPLTDPGSGMTVGVTVGALDLQGALAAMLRGPDSFAILPDFVYRLENGDWTALALLAGGQRFGEIPRMMALAMDCASGASQGRRERIEREARSTLLGDAINAPFPEVCAGVPIPDLGHDFRAPVESSIPALLISGTLDGRTPVENGEEVARHLANAVHLVIEGAGHSDPLFLSSPQILEAMQAFLREERIPTTRIVLENPVDFVPPRTVTDLLPEALDRLVGNYRIDKGDARRVTRVGSLLFTQRGRSQALPIRPTSPTRFFYEGSKSWLDFVIGEEGKVEGMRMHHEGAEEAEWAEKVE